MTILKSFDIQIRFADRTITDFPTSNTITVLHHSWPSYPMRGSSDVECRCCACGAKSAPELPGESG